MTLKAVLPFLILAAHGSLLGQELSLMQKGDEAMASRLWEVAALHYQTQLNDPSLDEGASSLVSIRLSEAWIRGGKADAALELLEQSQASLHPEADFWKAQALAATGRFAQAVDILKPLVSREASPHRQEAGLTASSLLLALDQADDALNLLSTLAESSSEAELTKVRMRQTEILLDLGRVEEARENMPARDLVQDQDKTNAAFIDANIMLREGRNKEAADSFEQIIEKPTNLSIRRYHASWIGLADALLNQEDTAATAELLLDFIQRYPDSPQLDEAFRRLLLTIPETPAISDPILERLKQWIPAPEIPETGLILTSQAFAVSAWPSDVKTSDLIAFSLFTRAAGLHRLNSEEAKLEARQLLTRLRLEYPTHFLATRALLMQARWEIDAENSEQANHLLNILRETATSPLIKGQAAFMQAHSSAANAQEAGATIKLFEEAASMLQGAAADTARFNAALIELTQADASAEPTQLSTIEDAELAGNLKLERALAIEDPAQKRVAIEEFLLLSPDHPRAAEARLAAADVALIGNPPDVSFAKAQIETIEADPEKVASVQPPHIALIKLRITDLGEDTEKTITESRTLIADFPASPEATEASFILGRNLFINGNYNDARIILEKLASEVSDTDRAQAAWLLAARAAALIPTSQSQSEALALFDKAITTDGPVTALAKLEKARLMIDMNQLLEAAQFLRPWYASLNKDNPLHLAAGLLLGESIYAQGSLDPESLNKALDIYNELLDTTEKFTPAFDRVQYLRGLTLEQLPNPDRQDQKRDKEALIAYYSVLERSDPPAQWEYFELCGFRALSLLEKARRWPAAVACAKKIASFKGPRAEEAAARANQIQLKHMIWED